METISQTLKCEKHCPMTPGTVEKIYIRRELQEQRLPKTILQALIDEIHYPIATGTIENIVIRRGLNADGEYNAETANSLSYLGALADCLYSLITAINFSEADKSVSLPSREWLLSLANNYYRRIGEEEKSLTPKPKVYFL